MMITSKMQTTDLMFGNTIKYGDIQKSSISWQLKINVTEFDIYDLSLRVTGDMHIGGVIFQLVEQLHNIKNDWSSFALWWPDKNQWLTKTKMTLDQYGVQGDAILHFTRTHKALRVQLPDHQILEMNADFSTCLFQSIRQICKTIGIRYSEELSLLKVISLEKKNHKKLENNPYTKNFNSFNTTHQSKEPDSNSLSSSNTSTLNNSLSNNSSSSKFRSSNSHNSNDNLNIDPQALVISPCNVLVQDYLIKDCPKYRNIIDKTRVNARWLDSSKSLMEQAVSELDLVQFRFKYFAFYELNAKFDAVRINQIYEQAKWSILSDEIDCTEQELISFAALQLQCQLQTKNYTSSNSVYDIHYSNKNENEVDRSILIEDSTGNNSNKKNKKKYIINENSAIYDDDDVDTALNKLEKSLDVVQVSDDSENKLECIRNGLIKNDEKNDEFKLELGEELFLMKPQKLTFKKFKSFYFVLDNTYYLGYFKNQEDSVNGRPIDKICLKGCELIPDVNVSHRKFGINLKVPSVEGMNEMSLRCPNEESYARWLSACKLASRNIKISSQAFKNETNSILNLLQMQQSKFNSNFNPNEDDSQDNFIQNKSLSLSSNADSVISRTGHADNKNFQANNLLTLRMLKKYKIKQLNDKILEAYSAISHLDLNESKWRYIKAWQALPSYGITYFVVKIKGSRLKEEIIGIASNRLMRINLEGETIKTWRFNTMKSWNVNWEIKQFEIIFDEELVVFTSLYCDPKIIHEFIGGYIYMSLRSQEKNNQIDEDMFLKLTEKR